MPAVVDASKRDGATTGIEPRAGCDHLWCASSYQRGVAIGFIEEPEWRSGVDPVLRVATDPEIVRSGGGLRLLPRPQRPLRRAARQHLAAEGELLVHPVGPSARGPGWAGAGARGRGRAHGVRAGRGGRTGPGAGARGPGGRGGRSRSGLGGGGRTRSGLGGGRRTGPGGRTHGAGRTRSGRAHGAGGERTGPGRSRSASTPSPAMTTAHAPLKQGPVAPFAALFAENRSSPRRGAGSVAPVSAHRAAKGAITPWFVRS